jgi:hypothetical protein
MRRSEPLVPEMLTMRSAGASRRGETIDCVTAMTPDTFVSMLFVAVCPCSSLRDPTSTAKPRAARSFAICTWLAFVAGNAGSFV